MILSEISKFQPKAWRLLSRSFSSDRIASTYLFHGREGLGAWPLAIALTALLNCEKPEVDINNDGLKIPCGQCRNCQQITKLAFPGLYFALPIVRPKNESDFIDKISEQLEIKREEPFAILSSASAVSISIDQARDIRKKLSLKSDTGTTRVVIFYQMEKMMAQSADALLKLIEEPPERTIIILVARTPESLLPTIQSRAQKIRLDRSPADVVADYIEKKYELSNQKAVLLSRIAVGSTGEAIEMLQRGDDDDQSNRAVGFLLYKSLFTESSPQTLSHIAELLNQRDKGQTAQLLQLWQALIRDCAYYAATGDENELINIDLTKELKQLSMPFTSGLLGSQMTGDIKNTLADLNRNVHIQGALMALSLKLKASIRTAAGH